MLVGSTKGRNSEHALQFHPRREKWYLRLLFAILQDIVDRSNERRKTIAAKSAKLDVIGDWSVLKLEIMRQYVNAYSKILTKHQLYHIYIDGFAGAGQHIVKRTKELIPGSPWNALNVQPPFRELHLIDLDRRRTAELRKLSAGLQNVTVYDGDANEILPKLFSTVRYEQFRRALCILDPYGLHLHWKIVKAAAEVHMGTIEIFLNFPTLDMNRNVLLWNPDAASPDDIARMNNFWGDESWRNIAYQITPGLFGEMEQKIGRLNEVISKAFRKRLKEIAGFKYVPEPMAMRNSKGAIVYYLFFAGHNKTGGKIAAEIFSKKRTTG